ncbi:hypothetical protein ACWFRF_20700 [Nocardia sp. NPDC055165]
MTAPDLTDLIAEGRRLLDIAIDPTTTKLVIEQGGIAIECHCGCGVPSHAITGPLCTWARPVAEYMAWAANAAPALLAEIDALNQDLAAKQSDFDAAMRRLGER